MLVPFSIADTHSGKFPLHHHQILIGCSILVTNIWCDYLEGISRHPDTRYFPDRLNASQMEVLPELSLQSSVMFPFARGSLTLLSPPIKRGSVLVCFDFASNGDYCRDEQLVKMQRLSVCGVPLEFRRDWAFEQLWDY